MLVVQQVLNYIRTYKEIPTLLVLTETLENKKLAEIISNIWVKVDQIKINEKEYLENGWKHLAQNVIVTKASKGCWYNYKDYPIKSPSEVRDVSGAGDTFLAALSYAYAATKNIETAIHYPIPVHKQSVGKTLEDSYLPKTEGLSQLILSIPIHENLSFEDVDYISKSINQFYKE